MPKPTQTELKQWLAGQLPEKIAVTQYRPFGGTEIVTTFQWIDHSNGLNIRQGHILETEWPAIVAMVERRLSESERVDYVEALWKLHPDSKRDDLYNWNQAVLSQTVWWHLTSSNWQTRTQALMKILP